MTKQEKRELEADARAWRAAMEKELDEEERELKDEHGSIKTLADLIRYYERGAKHKHKRATFGPNKEQESAAVLFERMIDELRSVMPDYETTKEALRQAMDRSDGNEEGARQACALAKRHQEAATAKERELVELRCALAGVWRAALDARVDTAIDSDKALYELQERVELLFPAFGDDRHCVMEALDELDTIDADDEPGRAAAQEAKVKAAMIASLMEDDDQKRALPCFGPERYVEAIGSHGAPLFSDASPTYKTKEDALHDQAEEHGKDAARELAAAIRQGAQAPLHLCHGCVPWLKDVNRKLYDESAELGIDGEVWETFEQAFDAEIEELGHEGWHIHGDCGDGSQGWLCDGTCEQCKEEKEEGSDLETGD